jgi:hypothetical protein
MGKERGVKSFGIYSESIKSLLSSNQIERFIKTLFIDLVWQ